jgi:hypothetical protein
MNNDQPQPDGPGLDEDLVAYLDGELDDATSKRLEERLANDESARQRLRALAVSWDLLDHLPRSATDESFTRTTVELIAVEARKDVEAEQAAIPTRKRRRWIGGIIAGLAAAMIGFVAVIVAWPDENERLLRDLPIVQNFELYDVTPEIDGIKFLQDLESKELFVGDAAENVSPAGTETSADGSPAREVLAARRAEVESLSADEKNDLRKLYERFRTLPKEEQERLRAFDVALRAEMDEARLRAVLASYHNWLPTLSPLERANLLKMSKDDAIKEIQRLKQEQLERFARSGGSRQGPLEKSDVDKIESFVQDWAWNKRDEILAAQTAEDQEWFHKLPDDAKKRSLIFLTRKPGPPRLPDLNDKEWQSLLDQLPTVKTLFESQGKQFPAQLSQRFPLEVQEGIKGSVSKAKTSDEKRNLLSGWYHRAQWARDAFAGGVSEEELARFLNEDLNDKEREDLLSRAPEDFNKHLRFLYHVKKELPPGHMRMFAKRGGFGRGGKGEHRGPEGGFGPGRRGGSPPEFDRDHKDRRDREGRHERNSGGERRRGPDNDDTSDDTSKREESASKAEQ